MNKECKHGWPGDADTTCPECEYAKTPQPNLAGATPRPWKVVKARYPLNDSFVEGYAIEKVNPATHEGMRLNATVVRFVVCKTDAHLIVTAVNSFDAMRDALENLERFALAILEEGHSSDKDWSFVRTEARWGLTEKGTSNVG